ncbi:hypothetical protein BGZ72_005120, partial [Mortierella alpina]
MLKGTKVRGTWTIEMVSLAEPSNALTNRTKRTKTFADSASPKKARKTSFTRECNLASQQDFCADLDSRHVNQEAVVSGLQETLQHSAEDVFQRAVAESSRRMTGLVQQVFQSIRIQQMQIECQWHEEEKNRLELQQSSLAKQTDSQNTRMQQTRLECQWHDQERLRKELDLSGLLDLTDCVDHSIPVSPAES